jgi:ribulose-5-phosphate 4-epimerase/fuculose-1-phosphate aldolase
MTALSTVIDDLVLASRILADQAVLDSFGHVSVRHPGNPQRYLLARAMAPALVTADDIMEFDLDSNPIDQRERRIFLERFIHGQVYRARADVNAVIHSHSPTVIPFSVTQVPLKPIINTASFLVAGVPVFDVRDVGIVSGLLVANNALGKALAATLGDKHVALLRGHGDVVVGPTLQRAVLRAIYNLVNARLLATALSFNSPITYISADEAQEPVRLDDAWDLLKRRVS